MERKELVKVLLSSKEDKIEIVIDKTFPFDSCVGAFQVNKDVWSPLIEEEHLNCKEIDMIWPNERIYNWAHTTSFF